MVAMERVRTLGLVGLLSITGYAAAADTGCSMCAKWNEDQAPFKIFGDTYYVGTHGLSSVLITSPKGHVLIDGALEESAPLIAKHVEQLGFKMSDVKVILNSHVHFDHAAGISQLQKLSGAKVMVSDKAAPVLRTGQVDRGDPQFEFLSPMATTEKVEALGDRQSVDVGDLSFKVIHTPGHTRGGTSWTWKSCEQQRCVNIVYSDSLTAVSDDTFKYSGDSRYPTAGADLTASIAKIAATPCDIVIPAHPDLGALWSVMDKQGKGDRTKLVDANSCKRLAEGAKEKFAQRLQQEKR